MKVVVETGGESHTSSSASLQAKFANGPYQGQFLYQQRQFQKSTKWEDGTNSRWVTTEYDLPEGTEIEIDGKGRSGSGGRSMHRVHRLYRLDSSAEVIDEAFVLGPNSPVFKARAVLVRDLAQEEREASEIKMDEGF